jgi:hypothetical protein
VGGAIAQDEPYFQPRFEATKTPTPPPPPPVYSFAKIQPRLALLCEGLESDGRRAKLVQIAEEEAKTERECISCRSFWRSFVTACGKLGPKPTPTPKVLRPLVSSSEHPGGAEGSPEVKVAVTPPDTPTAMPMPRPRYPSTALLDTTSRVSTELYSEGRGNGATYMVLDRFVGTVLIRGDLSAAEREYYEIFTTYLMAAWQGRHTVPRYYPLGKMRSLDEVLPGNPAPNPTPTPTIEVVDRASPEADTLADAEG